MKLFVGVQILATRSYDAVDGEVEFEIYLEAQEEDEAINDFVAKDVVVPKTEDRSKLIRKNFAEVWIWQFTNMRWVLALKHKA